MTEIGPLYIGLVVSSVGVGYLRAGVVGGVGGGIGGELGSMLGTAVGVMLVAKSQAAMDNAAIVMPATIIIGRLLGTILGIAIVKR